MNPGSEKIEFESLGYRWAVDGSGEVVALSKEAPPRLSEFLNFLIGLEAGHHIPTRLVVENALEGKADFRLIKVEEVDEPAGDVED